MSDGNHLAMVPLDWVLVGVLFSKLLYTAWHTGGKLDCLGENACKEGKRREEAGDLHFDDS